MVTTQAVIRTLLDRAQRYFTDYRSLHSSPCLTPWRTFLYFLKRSGWTWLTTICHFLFYPSWSGYVWNNCKIGHLNNLLKNWAATCLSFASMTSSRIRHRCLSFRLCSPKCCSSFSLKHGWAEVKGWCKVNCGDTCKEACLGRTLVKC